MWDESSNPFPVDSDLKGVELGLPLLLVSNVRNPVGEISHGGGGPLGDVLLCCLEVVPQHHTVSQSLRVGLYSLRDLKQQRQTTCLGPEQNTSHSDLTASLSIFGRIGRKSAVSWSDRCLSNLLAETETHNNESRQVHISVTFVQKTPQKERNEDR